MTLNSAISSALSGLAMASRATMTIASNVANATTDGYGRRELELVARDGSGGSPGVRVVTENRLVDLGLLNQRRQTDAGMGEAQARSQALSAIERIVGIPGTPGALSTRVADFSAALTEAASRPDSLARLDTVLREAEGLAGDIATLGRDIQSARDDADTGIRAAVDRLNTGLEEVQRLNRLIQREVAMGQAPNGLIDQRQRVIDELADLVPLREVPRPGGQVGLFTENGAILLDGRVARVELGQATVPSFTLDGVELQGLTIDGRSVQTGPGGPLSGGRIEGLFAVRDVLLPAAQDQVDLLARDLVARFEQADADPATPVPGGEGLFVFAGGPVGGPDRAQHLAITSLVYPAAPGDESRVWRLRTGLGGLVPGEVGDGRGLDALTRALESLGSLPGSAGPARDFAGHVADFGAGLGRTRDAAETQGATVGARNMALRDVEASGAVDTDAEMQRLLVIERLYAANARVLTAADEMMQRLLAI
ncbi:FlgK family flagellar hook-associated protein [Rhodobaculum claviforme]|uniref:Flagellar hook-associated protein 1 n=1 Tax=Rhodobaculum claviforme TaxID=1549854 RepID=A0A934TK66_9RHOB|nr:flagellar basal body rod C-terminal domain-containing protein [Rhodobaculum claviforme]MBK5927650.1 flagellar hook-associated protein FlgK [Rhodobaculum claviforme]